MVLGRLTRFACRPALNLSEALGQSGDKTVPCGFNEACSSSSAQELASGNLGRTEDPRHCRPHPGKRTCPSPYPPPRQSLLVPPALPRASSARAPPGTEGRGYSWRWGRGEEGDVGGGSGGPGGAWVGGDITRQDPHSGTSSWGTPPQALLQGVHLRGSRQDWPRTPCPFRAQAGLTPSSGPQLWHLQNGDSSSSPPTPGRLRGAWKSPSCSLQGRDPPGPVRAADSARVLGPVGRRTVSGALLGTLSPVFGGPWGFAQPR